MKLILILILSLSLFSYVGKIEPYKHIILKSEAVGKVSYINDNASFTYAKENIILKINNSEDLIRINSSKKRLEAVKEIYEISKYTFNNKKNIKSLSTNATEKDIFLFDITP